ncbi:MAG: D-alanyl-lipoteichoic acid biosynthesis protein DltB [Phycicoccus sp.]|nr:D-alanyl-lipoteichoic acid biosynthesis protein DltB [Phycicoccus sp.]
MIAFGSVSFFALLAGLAVPALVLGMLGKPIRLWGLAATAIAVGALFADHPRQLALLLAFVVGQAALMRLHLMYIGRYGRDHPWERRAAVTLALAPLALVKLAGMLEHPQLTFLGVSYLTFRAVQVILEISDGLIKRVNLLDYLYFVTFFPTIASGPIDRSRRFDQDLATALPRAEYLSLVAVGLRRIMLGALYKFVFAAWFAHWIAEPSGGFLGTVSYMYLYGLDLFFDFAGYSLMAVGASALFGIRTPMNFRLPFVAESIRDFWNRWHISLSFWFRDYVYSRLVMALIRRKVIADRVMAGRLALLVNMGLMGLWHGTGIQFLLYGLYHGVMLVGYDVYEKSVPWHKRLKDVLWYRLFMIVVTFHIVMVGFLIFSGQVIQ